MSSNQRPFDSPKKLSERLDIDFAIQAAGLGVWEVDPDTGQVIWDDRCRELFGLAKDNPLPYQDAIDYIHPEDRERVDQAVRESINPASDGIYDQTYRTLGADDGQLRWVRFQGKSYFGPTGELARFTGIAQEVTQQMQAQQIKEDSQRQLLALFEQSPVGLATYSADENFVIQWANSFFGELVARPPQVLVGKPLLEALPELKNQGFDKLLKNVTTTGIAFHAPEIAVDILRDGQLITLYVDLTYQPRRGAQGVVESILVVATDVTRQVQTRKAMEANEYLLRSLVVSAPIGISILNAPDLVIETANDAFVEVAGKTYEQLLGRYYWDAFPETAPYYAETLSRVVQTGEPFSINEVELMLIRHGNEEMVFVTFVFMPLKDPAGQVRKVVVWVLENTHQVTERRKVEEIVQVRTEELATANEELAATNEELATNNEEYAAINEELEEANSLLIRSNDNLQKFAYIASHDLQEPLRKIQQFGDLLKSRFADQLADGVDYIERMQTAASRMSTLIRDLLAYSRISTQRDTSESVSLTEVVNKALTDLELVVEETGASIQVGALPSVPGDASQLGQLFQNLLSNALKFRRPDTAPVIQIHYQLVAADYMPKNVTPSSQALIYHCIAVRDNGIGFEEKYLDRIFQVFQRLHGKSEITGTGIGLAICEKVAINHGGAITATSQPGQGAIFSVYLPV